MSWRVAFLLIAAALAGCAVGQRDPGCARDADCADGYACRAGACMRLTTPVSSAGDGGAGGGSGGNAGAGGH